jgi:hypothetical protein
MTLDADELAGLCAVFTEAERDCFKQWCALIDGHRRPDWDAVVASQDLAHQAATALRAWCLAGQDATALAEARRQELMVAQAEGELAYETAKQARHSAEYGDKLRTGWNSRRWDIICERDALTVGLGWPHRGERVIVTTFYYAEQTPRTDPHKPQPSVRVDVTAAAGIYSASHDVFEISHEVIVPALGGRKQHCSVFVRWHTGDDDERGPLGPADPAGHITLRVADAPDRPLPVPLQRWPKAADVGIAVPAPPPPPEALFGPAEVGVARQFAPRAAAGATARPRRPVAPPAEETGELTLF